MRRPDKFTAKKYFPVAGPTLMSRIRSTLPYLATFFGLLKDGDYPLKANL